MYCTLVLMAPTAFTSFIIKDTVSPLLYTKDIIVIDLNEAVQSHFKLFFMILNENWNVLVSYEYFYIVLFICVSVNDYFSLASISEHYIY